jgi:hypothetical protein
MKLTSHGCSFIYGCELSSLSSSWPALIAKKLGYQHDCFAVPGSGNLQIMESVLLHAATSDLCLINWTWIDRFDYVNARDEKWQTIRPSSDDNHAAYYFRHLHAQYRDVLTNLVYISAAIEFLQQHQTPFVMTYMDDLLLEPLRPDYHPSGAVMFLQKKIRPYLQNFNGSNFLDWSRLHSFPVSDLWHPLEAAHEAAAELMSPVIDAILHRA